MIAMMGLPSLMMYFSGPEELSIAVIDDSGKILPNLASSEELKFMPTELTLDSAKNSDRYDGVMVIGSDIVSNPDNVKLYTHENVSMQTEMVISSLIEHSIEKLRIAQLNIPNLEEIMQQVQADVHISTFTIGEEEENATSSVASYILGFLMMMMLYMFIILYGQMVMTSIIEEKNNRVLEVLVTTVKPAHTMIGKISGIGAVALTQIAFWALIVFIFTAWGLPALTSSLGVENNMDLAAILGTLGNPAYMMSLFGYLSLFLIAGYMFYSSLYAAIGSAVDNIQDASQLQSIAVIPVILGMVFSISVINAPNSSLAVTLSMIPFTAPMVMMTRLPFGVPVWQTLISLAIMILSVIACVWFATKVYRVGIFMYGKKPTLKELIKWARYK